jgi:predicted nucleic-acid-binding protein
MIKTMPTGSNNLSSDIDMQVMLNINCCINHNINKQDLQVLIKKTNDILTNGIKMWSLSNHSISDALDINIYPPTIINYFEKCDSKPISKINDSIKKYLYMSPDEKTCCLHPILTTDKLIKSFLKKEVRLIKNKYDNNTPKYYKKYEKKIAPSLLKLFNNTMEDKKINTLLNIIVKYNNIGPEMYFSLSTIIYVVWVLQMKMKMVTTQEKKDISIYAIISYFENKHHFDTSKKQKYKDRADLSLKDANKKYFKYAKTLMNKDNRLLKNS